MKKKIDKPCRRKKCPHYKDSMYKWCSLCQWNPNGVWIKEKEQT